MPEAPSGEGRRQVMFSLYREQEEYVDRFAAKRFDGNRSIALRTIIRYHEQREGKRLGIASSELVDEASQSS